MGAQTTLVNGLANLVFPAALLIYAHLLADGVLTLGIASKVGTLCVRVVCGCVVGACVCACSRACACGPVASPPMAAKGVCCNK